MKFHRTPPLVSQRPYLWGQLIASSVGGLWLGSLVAVLASSLILSSAAQACEVGSTTPAAEYKSPMDLSHLSSEAQRQLETTVQERRKKLPYQFLSLYRCPSLTNAALQAFDSKDYAQTLALLDEAIAESPSSLERWLNRAMVHYYLGNEAAARHDAQQVRHRLTAPRSQHAQEAYRQLMIELDGHSPDQVPDPRQAVELPS